MHQLFDNRVDEEREKKKEVPEESSDALPKREDAEKRAVSIFYSGDQNLGCRMHKQTAVPVTVSLEPLPTYFPFPVFFN